MSRRRWPRRVALALAIVVAAGALALMPLTTTRGIDHVVTSRTIPAYVKALDFVDRDVNYQQLARAVVGPASSDAAKLEAVLAWTRASIRDTPAGVPVVDDHPWNIIVRGYGKDDQQADVFTTLLSYAGVRAYWIAIGPGPELMLSFASIEGRWHPVDVANGIVFKGPNGEFAVVEDLARDHQLAARQGPPAYAGLPYARFFDRFAAPAPP
ncbi:MAG: hypothetical protein ACHQO8_13000, partial [Vicinamibacterales bacterium]